MMCSESRPNTTAHWIFVAPESELAGLAVRFAGAKAAPLPMGIFQMLLVAKGCIRGLRVPDPEGNNGAEHDAVVPGLVTAHDHAHGPEPETAEAVPVLHRPLVGAVETAVPFAVPHAPFGEVCVDAVTVMVNGASDALNVPSVTLITMLEKTL